MNTIKTSISLTRKLLQTAELDTSTTFSTKPLNDTTRPFDSSMAITILALLIALFFMAFFSLYIRRFSTNTVHQSLPSSKNRGLDASVINSLPVVLYSKPMKHQIIDDCPICLGELHEEEWVKLIPYCGHVFHPNCVDTWLKLHVTCPLCRSAQLFKGVNEVSLDVAHDMSDMCTDVGSSGMRRTRSCCNLRDDRVLRRCTSF